MKLITYQDFFRNFRFTILGKTFDTKMSPVTQLFYKLYESKLGNLYSLFHLSKDMIRSSYSSIEYWRTVNIKIN